MIYGKNEFKISIIQAWNIPQKIMHERKVFQPGKKELRVDKSSYSKLGLTAYYRIGV